MIAVMFVSVLIMTHNTKAQNPCEVEGINCDSAWTFNPNPTTVYLDGYPNCPVSVFWKYKDCNDMTYYELYCIGFPVDTACDGLYDELVPDGWGEYANQQKLAKVWREAFEKIAHDEFITAFESNTLSYHCPDTYKYKTITPGGCASWAYAKLPGGPTHPDRIRFIPVPCEEDGCCVTEIEYCYNEITEKIESTIATTQYYGSSYCFDKAPLYDPFEDYPPEWIRGPVHPCFPSCWIW